MYKSEASRSIRVRHEGILRRWDLKITESILLHVAQALTAACMDFFLSSCIYLGNLGAVPVIHAVHLRESSDHNIIYGIHDIVAKTTKLQSRPAPKSLFSTILDRLGFCVGSRLDDCQGAVTGEQIRLLGVHVDSFAKLG